MQVFDMNNRRRIWEQEIYFELKYLNPKDDVHIFEAERSMVAFHFAQIEEAADFWTSPFVVVFAIFAFGVLQGIF